MDSVFPKVPLFIQFIIFSLICLSCYEDKRTSLDSRAIKRRAIETPTLSEGTNPTENPNQPRSKPLGPLKNIETQKSEIEIIPKVSSPQKSTPEVKKRDLETELKRLVGNPNSCLKHDPQKEAANSIQIRIQAHVTPNGIITRSSVSSGSLNEIELNCIQKRVEASRLRAPIEDAPRMLQTNITLQRRTETKER